MFGSNTITGLVDKAIIERVSKLLAYVQRTQDAHRKDALQRYINESLYRIARVCKITGENYAYQFMSQLETSLGLGHSKNNIVVNDQTIYREFITHKFKTQSKNSPAIDSDTFKAFMKDKIPLFSADGAVANAEGIKNGENCFTNRKNSLLIKQNEYVGAALKKYIQAKLTKLEEAWNSINVTPSEIIDIKIELINRLERFRFSSTYTVIGYDNSNKFKRTSNGYDVDYDDFEKKVSRAISFHSPKDFISDALKLSERKTHLLKSVKRIKDSVLDGYSNQNKRGILDTFEAEINTLEANISNAKFDFFEAAKEVKDKLSATLLQMRKSEESYYSNDMLLFKGSRQANSSLQPRIDTANKLFVSEVLSVLDQNEHIRKAVSEIKSIITSYSGSSKKYIVQEFNNSMSLLEASVFGKANKNDIDAEGVAYLKSEMIKVLDAIQSKEHNHYNGKSFFQDYQRSNSSFQPKIKSARELVGNIQVPVNNTITMKAK